MPSVAELETAYNYELTTDKWAAAETAYALAARTKGKDPATGAEWARKAIELLEQFPSDTLEQVATQRVSVGGVTLPDYLHADVVRERFSDVL
ncbi:hypothetical protein LI90_3608 [Carbonactinospora thermoautotrophica]|uniref:Uncharacterized protein n=1 Tax=Carbonactinospora thermoautotrophica TaxID=1469144 RepID=A0A132MXD9_9ACTN|nr:hypothetical protein LI90_3608 [Carbonactinospora thermoautotrophica]